MGTPNVKVLEGSPPTKGVAVGEAKGGSQGVGEAKVEPKGIIGGPKVDQKFSSNSSSAGQSAKSLATFKAAAGAFYRLAEAAKPLFFTEHSEAAHNAWGDVGGIGYDVATY